MNEERVKILELLRDGKISTEQADLLIEALETKTSGRATGTVPPRHAQLNKGFMQDLKEIGSSLSSVVKQSLAEVKQQVEQQWDHWPMGPWSTVDVEADYNVPDGVDTLSVRTFNGRVQVSPSPDGQFRVQVRGHVRERTVGDGQRLLDRSVTSRQLGSRYEIEIEQRGVQDVMGATLNLYIPHELAGLEIRTSNGRIHVEDVKMRVLDAQTSNGRVDLVETACQRVQVKTSNGAVTLERAIGQGCTEVEIKTSNGRIQVEGMVPGVLIRGTARTSNGRVHIDLDNMDVRYEDEQRKNKAQFEQHDADAQENTTLARVQLETSNGAISIQR